MKFQKDANCEDSKPHVPQSILNYTVKYGGKEKSWFERNCDILHKGKKITVEYLLGQEDQTI